jgi:uncharacterized protein YdhG (YjbR/CyaY superfamily)
MAVFKSVDDYIAAQPEAARNVLNLVRSAVRKALPRAEEAISYRMPAYRLGGEIVIYFAAWKRHYSLYPVSARHLEAFKDSVACYELNDRGTLRFPLAQPVPVKLIAAIAKLRAEEVRQR